MAGAIPLLFLFLPVIVRNRTMNCASVGIRKSRHSPGRLIRRRIVSSTTNVAKNTFRFPDKYKQKEFQLDYQNRGRCSSFQHLGLHGLSDACDPNLSIIKRALWGILWLFLLLCCVTQCVISLKLYISSPTNVNIRYHKRKIAMPPCITLCVSDDYGRFPAVWQPSLINTYGNISYNTTGELLAATKMDINALWNITALEFDTLTYDIYSWSNEKFGQEHVSKSSLQTITGVCFTFKSLISMPCSGKQAYLHIAATGKHPNSLLSEFVAIFHSEAEIPLLHYYGPTAKGVFLPFNKVTTGILREEEETHTNSWNKRCISEIEYFQCEADCFEMMIRSESRLDNLCRLPFMKEDEAVPLCKTPVELREMQRATEAASYKFLDDDKSCNCHQPCRKVTYSEEYFLTNDDVPELFDLYIAFPRCHFQIVNEEFSYGTTHFISDIGGALGLYLGMSILSIVAFLKTTISLSWRVIVDFFAVNRTYTRRLRYN